MQQLSLGLLRVAQPLLHAATQWQRLWQCKECNQCVFKDMLHLRSWCGHIRCVCAVPLCAAVNCWCWTPTPD